MPSLVTVNVKNLAVGGAGVGVVTKQSDGSNLLGITAFVPFAAIGETVSARVTEEKKNHIYAQVIDIEHPSEERIEPKCPSYMICGGCELQHMQYSAQLDAKYKMITGAMRAARIPQEAIDLVTEVHPSSAFSYRRRITLHVDASGRVGFYRSNSRSVVPINECPISVSAINDILPQVHDFSRSIKGKLSSILLETDGSGLVVVLRAPYTLALTDKKDLLDAAKSYFKNVSLYSGEEEIGGFGRQILELPLNSSGTMTLQIPAGSFSQVNWLINLHLIERVVKLANLSYGKSVLELFAGAGNFTLPLAKEGADVTAIESDSRLVTYGRENASRYTFGKRIKYIEKPVEDYLNRKLQADVLLADPPRSGLSKLVTQIPKLPKLILVSCHLPSLVRDLKNLSDDGWKIDAIEPHDMFAQTSYVEVVAAMSRT